MAANPQNQQGGGEMSIWQSPIVPLVLIFLVFYFLLIRPQQKKQRELQEMINNLKKGDKVITTGGIFGTVVDVREKTVVLNIGGNTKIELLKNAISGKQQEKGK